MHFFHPPWREKTFVFGRLVAGEIISPFYSIWKIETIREMKYFIILLLKYIYIYVYIENVILSASSSTHRKICFFLSEKSYWLKREEKDGWDESVPANKKMPCWKCHTLSSVTSRYNSFLLVFMLLLCRQNIGWETKIQKANPELFINNVNVNHLPHISGNILYNLFAWYTL